MVIFSYLELHHLPLQQQPWELCCLLVFKNAGKEEDKDVEKEFKSTANKQVKKRAVWAPGLGRFSANLRRLVRLSAPSWFRIPGSISVICLFSACPVIVKVLAAKEAWTFGLLKWITVPWFVNIFTWSGGGVGSGGRKQFKVSVKEDNAQSKHPFPTISRVLISWQQLVSTQMAYTTDSLLFP